ncbi:hypothetical protein [Nitratireductor soli]|uniref:hypothetical protein n=1 Tax=Nitratireductor soli TaxID=1670619 RepID=UPI00065E4929|nr:hypothetical protein [Nitratireductor soli]
MGQIWVREFTGGLDSRRLPETTSGGVLIQAVDGHITRGGEFESRAAFVEEYVLPEGTVGMANTRAGVVVFGNITDPGVPSGVTYQRLEHPTDTMLELIDVPSFDLYAGKIYAVAVFSDGSRHHFYDGVRVEDWFDGRARVGFRVVGGVESAALSAEGSFAITAGTLAGGNEVSSVTVNSVEIMSAAVAHTGDNDTTAAAIAANINAHTSTPNYTASATTNTVTIIAADAGAAANGYVVLPTPGGDVEINDIVNMAGGADDATSMVTSIQVAGVEALAGTVDWSTNNTTAAEAIAASINSAVSTPDYSAITIDDNVVILAEDSGEAENGKPVVVTVANGFQITPSSGLLMAGGAEADDTFPPGLFVKTNGAKMNALSGPNWHFSGIQKPTGWTTDNTGAGFVDLSTYSSGSEEVIALAQYQNFTAIFAETNIQIWFTDPDPALNRQVQILNNTGTVSPHSVTQFGDSDLFYLNESGLRSLRARDASNAASTTDIGSPVDTLIIDVLTGVGATGRDSIFGLIEPQQGRFWLVMADQIFVLSFFSGAKVSAWTIYKPGFVTDRAMVFGKRVYLRSGNSIYVYGGLGEELTYDATEAIAQLPFLDADQPTQKKHFKGYDAAARGEWKVYAYLAPENQDARDKLGIVAGTTYNSEGTLPVIGSSTHISLMFRSQGVGPHKLGAVVIHHDLDDAED